MPDHDHIIHPDVEPWARCGCREERVTASLRQWHCTGKIVLVVLLNHEEEKEKEEEVKRGELAESGRRMQDIRAPLYLPAYERDIGERVSRLDGLQNGVRRICTVRFTPGVPIIFATADARFSEENDRRGNVDRFTSVLHGSIPWSGTSSNFSFTAAFIYVFMPFLPFSLFLSFSLLINLSLDFDADRD